MALTLSGILLSHERQFQMYQDLSLMTPFHDLTLKTSAGGSSDPPAFLLASPLP